MIDHRPNIAHRVALAIAIFLTIRVTLVVAHEHHGAVIEGEVYTEWTPRIIAHAILMLLALGGGIPYGVILAWRGSHLHKWVQFGTIVLITIAASLAIGDVSAEGHGHGQSVHGKLGILTLTLFLLQGFLGAAAKYLKTQVHLANEKTVALPQTEEKPLVVPTPLARPYSLVAVAHRGLAALLLLVLTPLTALFGLLTATGLIVSGPGASTDNKNLAAHVGFGGAIAAGSVALLVCGWQQANSLNSNSHDRGTIVKLTRSDSTGLDAPFVNLRPTHSILMLEYCIWLVSSIVVIISQHDWSTPMEYDGMDIQHVMMGIFAFVSSICGLILLAMTRFKIKREAAVILVNHPPGSVHAYRTAQMPHLLATRLPVLALYVALAMAMLGHAHGEPFSDNLHFTFAGYCILYGVSKLFGISPWVHIAPPRTIDSPESASGCLITGVEGVASRQTSPVDLSRHISRRNSQSKGETSAWQPGVWSHQEEAVLELSPRNPKAHSQQTGEPGRTDMNKYSSTAVGAKEFPESSAPPSPPPPLIHASHSALEDVGSCVLLTEEFSIDWSARDGVESAGRYYILSTYLMLVSGVTFSGSSKYGLIAASKKLSPVLYIVTLAIVSLLILTWIHVLIEGALSAREIRSKPFGARTRSLVPLMDGRGRRAKKAGYQHVDTASASVTGGGEV